jgi:transposase
VIVLDNLKEGVLTPDIYDPALNPLYRDVLAHYGVVALPCRVGDPDRKGKVEAGVGHAQKTPLRGLRFESLAEAQAYLDRWEAHWTEATSNVGVDGAGTGACADSTATPPTNARTRQ